MTWFSRSIRSPPSPRQDSLQCRYLCGPALGVFDSLPDDHAPEVLLAHDQCLTAHVVPEQGLDLISSVVTINDTTFTLSDADDLGVYLIHAYGLIPVGLGGMAPLSPSISGLGLRSLIPQQNLPLLGGLSPNHDDFAHIVSRSLHRIWSVSMIVPTSYAIQTHGDISRLPHRRRTRNQIGILTGNTPLCPDYCTSTHSGFAVSIASVPPPLCLPSPPRSARPGYTTPDRLALPRLTPTSLEPKSDSPPHATHLHPAVHSCPPFCHATKW